MSRLLKIAGREYVAYVKTVGFWLSMLTLPVVGGIGFLAPTLIESRSPPSIVAIVDQTGQGLGADVVARVQGQAPARPRPGLGKTPELVLAPAGAGV